MSVDTPSLQRLHELSTQLIEARDTEALYEQILDTAVAVMRSQFASMQMLDATRGPDGELRLLGYRGFSDEAAAFWAWVRPSHASTCGIALRTLTRVFVSDVETCEEMAGSDDLATYRQTGIRAVQTTPLFSRAGSLLGMISTHWREPHEPDARDLELFDILARQAAHLIERRQVEDALREADRNKDVFLAMLAHELRNPLAPLRTGIEVLRLSAHDPAVIHHAIAIMERQTEHMVRLVDDLLDASRITQGKIVLQRSPTPLARIVDQAVETNRALILRAEIELEVRMPETACVLDVDATRLVQVVSNLLHNAAKFTPPHGRIELSAEVRGDELELVVADTGAGIPAELLSRMFTLFAQGERPKHHGKEGLGIGLALARHIVELHDGTIEARSDGPGRGSSFHIVLPVLSGAIAPEASARATAPAVELERRHVVIIDDNRDAANALAMLVRANGGYPHVAYDGATGFECVRTVRPHLVLLDIGMPDLDGHEICRRIRREPFGHEVVVIAVSGWGKPEDKQRALAAGFTAHLTKPADPAEIRRYLQR